MTNIKNVFIAIIQPPLLIGIVGGLLIGADWMFDNHPELLGVIMILIAWAVWSIIIYNRDEDYG